MEGTKEFRMGELRKLKEVILEKTGISIKDKSLLHRVFKRGTKLPKQNLQNNENLEFVGASILEFYVTQILEERYGCIIANRDVRFNGECRHDSKRKLSGILAIRNDIVGNKNLASIIDEWALDKYMIVEQSIEKKDAELITAQKAELFKSILGAAAITSQWNQDVLKNVVVKMINIEKCFEKIDSLIVVPKNYTLDNAINMLEEILKQASEQMPAYNCTDSEIYESDGMRWFCSCSVASWGITVGAYAKDKNSAKKYAAYVVLCKRFGLINVYEPNVDGALYKLKDESM